MSVSIVKTKPAGKAGFLRRLGGLSFVFLLSVAVFGRASAQQEPSDADVSTNANEVHVTVGGGHSDNIRRSAANPESGSYKAVGLQTNILRDSRRLDARFVSDLEQRNYSVSDLDNELYGTLDASLEIDALPDRISWFVGDNYGQGRSDAFQIDRPGNRNDVNVFSTGPRFSIPISARMDLRISGTKLIRTFAQNSGLDSDVIESKVGLFRSVSTTSEIGIGISSRKVDYQSLPSDFRVDTATIGYNRELSSGMTSLTVGTNSVDYGATSHSDPFLDASWERDIATRSNVALSLNQQYIDVNENFRYVDPNDLLLHADVYRQRAFGAQYAIGGNRTKASIQGRVVEARYVNDSTFDFDENSVVLRIDRTISPKLDVEISAQTGNRDYKSPARHDDRSQWGVSLNRSFSNRLSLSMRYDDISQKGLQTDTVDEKVFRLFLDFGLIGANASR